MRRESVKVKTRKEAFKKMPWAAMVKKVEGGYMGWESVSEFKTWKNQK